MEQKKKEVTIDPFSLKKEKEATLVRIQRYKKSKRYIGFLLSLIGLILISPLLLIISLSIKVSDWQAPIIFKQIRIGENGRSFCMYKFRTMHPDAEAHLEKYLAQNEIAGAMFKMKDDPRVTRIGRFLRKTSLDELPQLLNVLKGEMALVGPRPPLPREVKAYTSHDMRRLTVTPGCTGLWQVSGRNQLDFHEMVALDIAYIDKMSLMMDTKIILATFRVMFTADGAS